MFGTCALAVGRDDDARARSLSLLRVCICAIQWCTFDVSAQRTTTAFRHRIRIRVACAERRRRRRSHTRRNFYFNSAFAKRVLPPPLLQLVFFDSPAPPCAADVRDYDRSSAKQRRAATTSGLHGLLSNQHLVVDSRNSAHGSSVEQHTHIQADRHSGHPNGALE